ncbi:putative porin [Hymenobacter sp. HDW8]|uniref:putative porin n=1 Tax=Hymenobacter sp. HDW8 TaxID=2714932 RepID=UPI0014092B98|nr:putative porin [Hymenobacter sp. HDW8]QIL75011.1 putative porin [Hymenobacter sp. HDW8]
MPHCSVSACGLPASRLFRWLTGLLLALGGFFDPLTTQAQVVDDTTKTLYGAKTTFVIREADVLREKHEGRMVDTTLVGMQQARNWYHDSTFQQDLGNGGTASRRLLWEPNTQLGARLGRNVFDKYMRNSATIPYYDTRSPYTFFRFVQGGTGEQVFELSYSRSIKRNANVGFAYERFSSNKIFTDVGAEGLTRHSGVLFFVRYQTTDDRYHLLFNVNTARHEAIEQGGIVPQPEDISDDNRIVTENLFEYDDERVWLTQARNRDDRDRIHLAQTYRLLGKGLTAFHVMDISRQTNRYNDDQIPRGTTEPLYYPRTRLSPNVTNDRATFEQAENSVGVLGATKLVEYRLYGRHRLARLSTSSLIEETVAEDNVPIRTYNQIFLGGNAAFKYRVFGVEAAGEIKVPDISAPGEASRVPEYWGKAAARTGPITAEFYSASYAPTLTEREFSGNHYEWNNYSRFENTFVNQLTGRLDQSLGKQRLQASVAVANISSLVYYNEQAEPAQLSEQRQLVMVGVRHRFQVGNFFADNQGTYTLGGDQEGLRIPSLVANAKVYYQGYIFKKALFGQIGTEYYYQSRFRAYDYSPSTQQFFVQDQFRIRRYSLLDAFVNIDIRTVSVFLKMAYLNQGLHRNGYFTTPYYTGLPRRFEVGLKWQFFD